MKPLTPISLVDQTENALRSDIARGLWKRELPGSRALRTMYGVSAITMATALQRLVDAKWLLSRGPRKRLLVPNRIPVSQAAGAHRGETILFLTEEPLHELPHYTLEILYHLRTQHPDWNLVHRTMPYQNARKPLRSWDQILRAEEPDRMIVVSGSVPIARWALDRKVPAAFVGGSRGGLPVPSVGFSADQNLVHALEELLKLGHRRICLPMFGLPEKLVERLRKAMQKVFEDAGIPFVSRFQTPASPQSNPDVVMNLFQHLWSTSRPTAVIFMDWKSFMTTHCFLRDLGIRIPKDLSVILMMRDAGVSDFRPLLTHFDAPCRKLAASLGRWVLHGFATPDHTVTLPLRFVKGGSIAPPGR